MNRNDPTLRLVTDLAPLADAAAICEIRLNDILSSSSPLNAYVDTIDQCVTVLWRLTAIRKTLIRMALAIESAFPDDDTPDPAPSSDPDPDPDPDSALPPRRTAPQPRPTGSAGASPGSSGFLHSSGDTPQPLIDAPASDALAIAPRTPSAPLSSVPPERADLHERPAAAVRELLTTQLAAVTADLDLLAPDPHLVPAGRSATTASRTAAVGAATDIHTSPIASKSSTPTCTVAAPAHPLIALLAAIPSPPAVPCPPTSNPASPAIVRPARLHSALGAVDRTFRSLSHRLALREYVYDDCGMSLVHPPRLTRPSRTGRRFPVHLPDHLPDNPSAGALTAALADLPDTYVPRSPGFIPRYEPNPFLAWDPDPDPDVRHPPPSCN